MNTVFQHLAFVVVIGGFSAVLTAALIRHLRLLDVPNERSSHTKPTPRGGGLAIVAGFLLGLALLPLLGDAAQLARPYFPGFLAGLGLIVLIALYDDLRAPGAGIKFAVQLMAILIVMALGMTIDRLRLPQFELIEFGWWAYPLTLVWILGLTNAYNFMDGLDGMAGGTALMASVFFAWLAFRSGSQFVYLPALAIAAASFGFLLFNWSPARIFMGDVGSTFLGFGFAVLAIIAARQDAAQLSILVMPLLLLHFIFDTVFTFLRRLIGREVVWRAHRTHLYQLLNRLGYSHRQISGLYTALALLQGTAALWLVSLPAGQEIWVFVPFLLMYGLFAAWVIRQARRCALI